MPDTFAGFQTRRQRYDVIVGQLEIERSSFLNTWRDVGDYITPRRPRFYTTDVNKGDRRNLKIIDATATIASRTLRSGMMSGITSPSRPWFQLTVKNRQISELPSVKAWLYEVGKIIFDAMGRSNLYRVLPTIYGDMGDFGTSAMLAEEDVQNYFKFDDFAIGSYMISRNNRGYVDTFYREFTMTVRQLIEEFGRKSPDSNEIDWSRFTRGVKDAWENGRTEQRYDVCHIVLPNQDFDLTKQGPKYMRYESVYYEKGGTDGVGRTYAADDQYNKYLRISGYPYFPVLAACWDVTGEDDYGTDSPGIVSLGDVKQLQKGEQKSLQAIEKMVNPPMKASPLMRNQPIALIAGGVSYMPDEGASASFEPVYQIQFRVAELEQKQEQVRRRIQRAYFEDLFLMMLLSDRKDITATEIVERKEEKLLALGPVLERLNQDLLDPLIDICFNILVKQGQIPPPPQELQGQPLTIEYVSIMAQAQKLVAIGGVERASQFVAQLAQVNPMVLDKINFDELVDKYGEMVSLPPGIVRTYKEVAALRNQRAQAQAQQQRSEQMLAATQSAKNLSDANVGGDENALMRLVSGGKAV